MKKIVLIASVALVLVACKKKDSNFTSRISFLNACINGPALGMKLNGDPAITNLFFPNLQYYRTVPSGTFDISFSGYPSLTGFRSNMESNEDYLFFICDSASKVKYFFQKEAVPTAVTEGKSAVRFFSLVPSSSNIAFENDTSRVLIAGQTFNSYSNTFTEVDTTTRSVKAMMITSTGTIKLDSVKQSLLPGKVYTIFLTGTIGGTGNQKPTMVFWQHN